MLGVGEDGHVASLFPGMPALFDDRAVVGVRGAPKPPPTRLSLTFSSIASAHEVWLITAGAGKAAAVNLAVSGAGPVEIPAAGAHGRQRTLWLLDEAAGKPASSQHVADRVALSRSFARPAPRTAVRPSHVRPRPAVARSQRSRNENTAVARARPQSTATAASVACCQLRVPGCEPMTANTTVPSTDAPVARPICNAVERTPPANPARSTGKPASTRPTRGTITAPQPNPTTINGAAAATALSVDPLAAATQPNTASPAAKTSAPTISTVTPKRTVKRRAESATAKNASAHGPIVRPDFNGE